MMFHLKHKVLLATVFGILAVIGVVVLYLSLFGAPQKQAELKQFTIPTAITIAKDYNKEVIGSREITNLLAEELKEKRFIKSTWGFGVAIGDAKIESGAYKISKAVSVWELARVLKRGPYMKWVVIPEGLRKEQIAELLADTLGWTDQEKSSWINTHTSQTFDEVEGVYFPDTYLIPVDDGLQSVADRLRVKFNEKFKPYLEEANRQNIKWTTLLKIASLVQREASGTDDMSLIAGILWNRLLQDMKLDIDATVQYARGNTGDGWWTPISIKDKQIDSPYNTYMYKGLPPHPISNPGLEAINAVLQPAKTSCIYYLHDSNKEIHCADTYEEHKENIKTYLR